MHRRGKRIVRRLAAIHVVVGVDRLFGTNHATGKLNGAIGDHLVRVHVGLRARTGLENYQRELVVPFAVNDFLRRANDQIHFLFGKLAEFAVGESAAFLQHAQGSDHLPSPAESLHADDEVQKGPLRLCAPQPMRWNFHLSHRILFHPKLVCFMAGCHSVASVSQRLLRAKENLSVH